MSNKRFDEIEKQLMAASADPWGFFADPSVYRRLKEFSYVPTNFRKSVPKDEPQAV